ncbi:MAG: hypothetical protein AVDCRST_MAG57-1137, partial [uncultured Blastococcus sp.]
RMLDHRLLRVDRPDRSPPAVRGVRREREQRLVPGVRLRRLPADRLLAGGPVQHHPQAVQRRAALRHRLLHPLRRALRRLELQPRCTAAGLLRPPTDPI